MDRRDFLLATTAAAGAGLAFGAKPIRAASLASNEVRVALIGAGAQGQVLLDASLQIPNIRFVAVCDIWTEYNQKRVSRLLNDSGHPNHAYVDYKELLDKEKDHLDAVIVATPDFWHAEHAIAAMKAGLQVYCEKEMSNNLADARRMVLTARETGKLLQIGHQRRSNPRYLFALHRLLQEAKICGRLTAAQAQWNRAVAEDFGWPKKAVIPPETLAKYGYKDMHQFRNWRWLKGLGGGPLSDLGAHQIDIFNWWFGISPRSVMASGGVDYYKTHEWYDNAMVIYEFAFPDGVKRAFYQVQTTTSAGGGYFEMFMGDEGSIKMSEDPKLSAIYREARAPSWDALIAKNYIRAQAAPAAAADATKVDVRETAQLAAFDIPVSFNKKPHQPHLENFFNAIRGKNKLNCPGDEAFRSEYVIHKANEAIAAGKRIDIAPGENEA